MVMKFQIYDMKKIISGFQHNHLIKTWTLLKKPIIPPITLRLIMLFRQATENDTHTAYGPFGTEGALRL